MIKIFSGSANPQLSKEVCRMIGLSLSQAEVIRFDNSETKVTIKENVADQDCVVIQPTANPTDTHLMELVYFCDALKRQEAKKVIAVIPYFGYARQNIQHREGECVSANVVIRFLEAIGFDKIYTIDLHDEATEGVFSIPFKNLSALPLLAEKIKQNLADNINEITIVSPDQGGIERARKFSIALFDNPPSLAVVEKKRNLEKAHQSQALDLYGNVKGRIAILVDDIITSGKTLINAAQLCLNQGAKKVYAAVVHHDFSPDSANILQNSNIEKIFTTDTIELKAAQRISKLEVVSVAPIIGEIIEKSIKQG
jgi:ribose-phosphate pyrophosphokinase